MIIIKYLRLAFHTSAGLVAQWITRLTTDQKIPGSNPGKVDFLLTKYIKTQMNKSMASVGIPVIAWNADNSGLERRVSEKVQ